MTTEYDMLKELQSFHKNMNHMLQKQPQQPVQKAQNSQLSVKAPKAKQGAPLPPNSFIFMYSCFTMLCCSALSLFLFNQYLPRQWEKAFFWKFIPFSYILVHYYYYKGHTTKNFVQKMNDVPKYLTEKKYIDAAYDPFDKLCQHCQWYKGPRVSHCSTCGMCTYKLEHHCIWTQNCIGYKNQKYFFQMIMLMISGIAIFWYHTYTVITFIHQRQDRHFFKQFPPYVYLLWIITAISSIFKGILLLLLIATHYCMVSSNFLTLDTYKSGNIAPIPVVFCFTEQFETKNINIYDRGQIQNFKDILGPTILDFLFVSERKIQNQFIVQKMHPYPTQKQIKLFNGEINQDIERQNILRKQISLIKKKYSQKKFKIRDQIIIL